MVHMDGCILACTLMSTSEGGMITERLVGRYSKSCGVIYALAVSSEAY